MKPSSVGVFVRPEEFDKAKGQSVRQYFNYEKARSTVGQNKGQVKKEESGGGLWSFLGFGWGWGGDDADGGEDWEWS